MWPLESSPCEQSPVSRSAAEAWVEERRRASHLLGKNFGTAASFARNAAKIRRMVTPKQEFNSLSGLISEPIPGPLNGTTNCQHLSNVRTVVILFSLVTCWAFAHCCPLLAATLCSPLFAAAVFLPPRKSFIRTAWNFTSAQDGRSEGEVANRGTRGETISNRRLRTSQRL